MRVELEPVLMAAQTIAPEHLPKLLGELEEVRATALARLTTPHTPEPAPSPDALLDVQEAARTLAVSESFLYRNASKYTFTRRMGRALKFSSRGIQDYLRGNRRGSR